MAQLTKAQSDAVAQANGIDWNNIPWDKVLSIIQFLIQLFGQKQQFVAKAKAAGCTDDQCEQLHQAIGHSLAAAQCCCQCCCQ